jgi:signal peptidase I
LKTYRIPKIPEKSEILNLKKEDFTSLAQDVLGRGKTLRFKAKGGSMSPFIRNGDIVKVVSFEGNINLGDVVFYRSSYGNAIIHRVIRKTMKDSGTVFFIKGDAGFDKPEKVDAERVLGRVAAIERNGRKINLHTKLYRIIGLFFAGLSPFSRWIYPMGSKVKHKGRRLLGVIFEKLQGLKLYGFLAKKMMKENIHYKIATPSDAHSVSQFYMYDKRPESENPIDTFKEQLENPKLSGYWLVAKQKDNVIGGVSLTRSQEGDSPHAGWWLFGMKVNWRYRRMGIGEKLTRMAADIAAKHGASEIKLLVFEDARRANNLYRKSGFRQISIPELDKQLQEEAKKTSRLRIILAKNIKSW